MQNDPNLLLEDYPNAAFDAFLMMRFDDSVPNQKIVDSLRVALRRYALNILRADQKAYADSLSGRMSGTTWTGMTSESRCSSS